MTFVARADNAFSRLIARFLRTVALPLKASALAVCALHVGAVSAQPASRYDPKQHGEYAVADRVVSHWDAVKRRLAPYFDAAGVAYPPAHALLLGLKQERRLELYAGTAPEELRYIRNYSILATSGGPGPKLHAGDRQVPEGIYRIISLNPSSRFHLSLQLNYPNAFDRSVAQREGRLNLGGDIFIHGGMDSVGCLSIGNRFVEELFVLTAVVGTENVEVVLSPHDFRLADPSPAAPELPSWTARLYEDIARRLERLPSPTW